MMKSLNIKIKYPLFIILLLVPIISFGQFPDFGSGLVVNVSPSFSSPNSKVSINVESFSFDLSDSIISWFVNGVIDRSFSNRKNITLQTGGVGSALIVDVSVRTPSGSNVSERVVIRPSSLDLLWESEALTSPFYKGKALHPSSGKIKVLAMADIVGSGGFRLGRDSLHYTWKRDNKVLEGLSGVGKNSVSLSPAVFPIGETRIGLDIKERGRDNVLASKNIRVVETPPKILFYENHPLLGINFSRALSETFPLQSQELEIKAYPYFFSAENTDNLTYEWRVNRERVSAEEDNLLVRAVEESGRSIVSLQVKNLLKNLQSGSSSFFIEFGNN